MGSKKATGKNTLEGLVIPHKRDDNGKITGIAIRTNKGGLYLVAHNRMEGELLSQIHNQVGIEGKIMERLDGSMLVHVRSFKPILIKSNENYDN